MAREARRLPPFHPGEIPREDLLKPLGISINLDSAQRDSAGRIARDVSPCEAA